MSALERIEIDEQKLASIAKRIKMIDEMLGSISHITTGQGSRAQNTWDRAASILADLRDELERG